MVGGPVGGPSPTILDLQISNHSTWMTQISGLSLHSGVTSTTQAKVDKLTLLRLVELQALQLSSVATAAE